MTLETMIDPSQLVSLKGKKFLVLGVANERSIAWAITEYLSKAGAQIGLTYVNEAIEKRVRPFAEQIKADFVAPMDVNIDENYTDLKNKVKQEWGTFDGFIHSLAFAQAEDLKGKFSDTSRYGFRTALEVSAYSLIGLSSALKDLLNPQASIVALSYYGAHKVIQNYNIMGVAKAALECSVRYLAADLGSEKIRVNCISAGPIKTLASSGVSGFRNILKDVEEKAPLKENIDPEDVAKLTLFLCSSLAERITGQVMYVDSGHSIMAF